MIILRTPKGDREYKGETPPPLLYEEGLELVSVHFEDGNEIATYAPRKGQAQ